MKFFNIVVLSVVFSCGFSCVIFAEKKADHHAGHHHAGPLGIPGDHVHKKGERMFSYRHMQMVMKDHRLGSSKVSEDNVLTDFMVTPTRMVMHMHMFGFMYATSDLHTAMLMLPYKRSTMNHRNRAGVSFSTKSEGVGDIAYTSLFNVWHKGVHRLQLGGGISLPTGSIDERDETPMGSSQKLPYPMQLGSGTWDVLPSITYAGSQAQWSWGTKVKGTWRLGRNSNGYALGDELAAKTWIARELLPYLSLSTTLDSKVWGDVGGADSDIRQQMMPGVSSVPTAQPELRGGRRVDLSLGVTLQGSTPKWKNHQLALTYGVPIYESLHGPQLGVDRLFSATWQIVW